MTFYPNLLVGNQLLANPVTVAQGGTGGTTPVPWLPQDQGTLLAAIGDPWTAQATILVTAGTVYLVKLTARQALTITNIILITTAAGSGTSTGSFVGVYSSAGGAPLSGSADLVTPFTAAAGPQTCALTTPQAVAAGAFVWVAILSNLTVTQPTFAKGISTTGGIGGANVGLTAATLRFAVNGTVQTSLPTIVAASNTQTNASDIWVGVT